MAKAGKEKAVSLSHPYVSEVVFAKVLLLRKKGLKSVLVYYLFFNLAEKKSVFYFNEVVYVQENIQTEIQFAPPSEI